jgi:hypothetical protein
MLIGSDFFVAVAGTTDMDAHHRAVFMFQNDGS